MYRKLDSGKIVDTLEKLGNRIEERFPGRGLAGVCEELTTIARVVVDRAEVIDRPQTGLRMAIAVVFALGLFLLIYLGQIIDVKRLESNLFGVMQGIEAIVNVVVLMGAAFLFLVTIEIRIKRRRALADLHELRSIVHVIDMHQLTKDPGMVLSTAHATASSPSREMSVFELTRYLDYCSEMLSLTGKVAALYAQNFGDSAVISNVNEIEQLTTNLSRKIWQKIMILKSTEYALESAIADTGPGQSGDIADSTGGPAS